VQLQFTVNHGWRRAVKLPGHVASLPNGSSGEAFSPKIELKLPREELAAAGRQLIQARYP